MNFADLKPLSLSWFGLGVFLAWLFLVVFDPTQTNDLHYRIVLAVFLVVAIVARLVAALGIVPTLPGFASRSLVIGSTVLSTLGTLFISLSRNMTSGAWPLLAGTIIAAVGASALGFAWGSLFRVLARRQISIGVSLSMLIGAALYLFVGVALRPEVIGVVVCLLPPIGGALWLICFGRPLSSQVMKASAIALVGQDAWRSAIVANALGLAVGVTLALVKPDMNATRVSLLVGATWALFLALTTTGSAETSITRSFAYRPVLALMAAGLLLQPYLSPPWNTAIITSAYLASVPISWSHWPWGTARLLSFIGAGEIGVLFGVLLGYALAGTFGLSGVLVLWVSLGLLCILFAATGLLLMVNNPLAELETPEPQPQMHPIIQQSITQHPLACERVSEMYGLSSREGEVLRRLVRGRSIAHIAEEFDISMNTSKSHVRNIYNKLGVHTRQELLDLIQHCSNESGKL